ncbi:MAG TPA: DUF4089 domain-containing protein [Magnetospirillaceae bacterium]|jgi:hypothetical protein
MTNSPSQTEADRAALLDASMTALGIPLAQEWRADVLMHMNLLREAALLLEGFALDDAIEPAPIFIP